MLQSIGYDLAQAAAEAFNSGLLSALCSIQTLNASFGPSGAPANTWTDVSGMTNLACQVAVPSANAVQATEVKALEEIMAKSIRHVLLGGYFPTLKRLKQAGQVRALITLPGDATQYAFEILGSEDDSQGTMTRFECEWVTL